MNTDIIGYTPIVTRLGNEYALSALPGAPVVPERPSRLAAVRHSVAVALHAVARVLDVPAARVGAPALSTR